VGTDGGDLLCFDADGTRLWTVNLGDKVTRIVPVELTGDGVPEIACAAESANVFAVRANGSMIWRTALPDGVGDLALLPRDAGPLLVATAGTAGIVILDAQGRTVAAGDAPGRAQAVVTCEGRAVVTSDIGAVHAFDLPRE
jgi:outer membrane protein assembly factor BamB